MEDLVIRKVNELFDEERRAPVLGYCTCRQCRLDVSCYALNRIEPLYVISQRGLAHTEAESMEKSQRKVDIAVLVREGMEKINKVRRPHFSHSSEAQASELPSPPVYNFPAIVGRIFNGTNFEPIQQADAQLRIDGKDAEMISPNWRNPYSLSAATPGTFLFWPMPLKAESLGPKRAFALEIRFRALGFEELTHYFSLELSPEETVKDSMSAQERHSIGDLYIFPK
jgi:competence protein ComFB